ncbi:hypothetical protein BDC45DRAFT_512767 [Circinella umbellata]|nr:hypothetical protein BDC45DRAFT_512767 [Circinella umbellata]
MSMQRRCCSTLRTIHTQLQKSNLKSTGFSHSRVPFRYQQHNALLCQQQQQQQQQQQRLYSVVARSMEGTTHGSETTEKHHKVTLDFNKKNIDDIWADYTERVNQNQLITDSDFIILCARIKKESGTHLPQEPIRRIQSILREIHKRQLAPDTFIRGCNMLIHLFITHGDMKSAKLVVDGMMRSQYHPDPVTVKTIVGGLKDNNQLSEIHDFYQHLQERNMWPEITEVYKSLIWMFANREDLEGARHYFAHYLRKKNMKCEDEKNVDCVYNAMIQLYGAVHQPEGALSVYQQMIKRANPLPTTATYHILLGVLHQYDMQDRLEEVYTDLKQAASQGHVGINGSHLSAMGWDPKKVLKEMEALNIPCNLRDYNTFIASYVKENQFQEALDIFNTMVEAGVEPDVYSYSIILDTLAKDQQQSPEVAFNFYDSIKKKGLKPDEVIYTSLISACARTEDMDRAMSLLKEMEGFGLQPNIFTFNSLFSLLSRKRQLTLPDDIECVDLLWNKMKELRIKPDTRSYNMHFALLARAIQPSIIKEQGEGIELEGTALWRNKGKVSAPVQKMLELYRNMRRHCRPDFASHTIMINTLLSSGHVRQAMQVYDDAKISRMKLPVSVYNEMMGALEKAKQISQMMTIWHDMKTAKVLPDSRSYTLALDACEQLGLVESFETIRSQRKMDIDRLMELDKKQMERMEIAHTHNMNNNNNNNSDSNNNNSNNNHIESL